MEAHLSAWTGWHRASGDRLMTKKIDGFNPCCNQAGAAARGRKVGPRWRLGEGWRRQSQIPEIRQGKRARFPMDYAVPLLVAGIVSALALYGVRELIREVAVVLAHKGHAGSS